MQIYLSTKSPRSLAVKYKKGGGQKTLDLEPGWNDVDDELWALLKTRKPVLARLKARVLIEQAIQPPLFEADDDELEPGEAAGAEAPELPQRQPPPPVPPAPKPRRKAKKKAGGRRPKRKAA